MRWLSWWRDRRAEARWRRRLAREQRTGVIETTGLPDGVVPPSAALALPPTCEGADFSRVAAHLEAGLREHADRDGLSGVRRAVFLARGGHAPGERCPQAVAETPDRHEYWCQWPDDECACSPGGAA